MLKGNPGFAIGGRTGNLEFGARLGPGVWPPPREQWDDTRRKWEPDGPGSPGSKQPLGINEQPNVETRP